MAQLSIGPELHAYLVAAVKRFDSVHRRDPSWLKDLARIEQVPADQRSRRDNALLSSDLVMARLYDEALALLDEAREDPEEPRRAVSAG